jgi:hypothetical protein
MDAARRRGVLGLADGILRHATLNLFRVATEVQRVIQVGRERRLISACATPRLHVGVG